MEPRKPDPITAAEHLRKLPNQLGRLSTAFVRANQEGLFPEWRQHQILAFLRYVGFYGADLNHGYEKGLLHLIAQPIRNLMELSIWIQYCGADEKDAKEFFDDAARDMRDMITAVQKLYTSVNKEPENHLESMLNHLRTIAPKYNILDLEKKYTEVSNAADKIGKKYVHSPIYKATSKFTHPTALLLAIEAKGLPDLQDSLYEGGSKLAVSATNEIEKQIRTKYPNLKY